MNSYCGKCTTERLSRERLYTVRRQHIGQA